MHQNGAERYTFTVNGSLSPITLSHARGSLHSNPVPRPPLELLEPPWWRILETRDEYIRGPAGWWLYGMGLPDNVLEAVYNGNAKRLLNWTKPSI
jgi:hypothetical protein